MNMTTLIGLINNAALLLALGLLYDTIALRRGGEKTGTQVLTGVLFGAIGLAVMTIPWELMPGVIFDTRSVLLSVGGLFLGPIPTLVAVLMTAAYRFLQGGFGAWTGVGVIVTSGLIGVLWRHFRRGTLKEISALELYIMGIVVHVVMLLWMFTLPNSLAFEVLSSITVPVLLVYPVGTTLLGLLMSSRLVRSQAEEVLRQSEEKFRSIIEQSEDGIFITDEQGRIIAWNRSLEQLTGLPTENMLGRPIWEAQFQMTPADQRTPEVYARLQASLQEFLKTGQAPWSGQLLEREYLRPDGSRRFVQGITFPIRTPKGFILGSITRDLTERRLAEETRRESEAALQSILRAAPIGIGMVTDRVLQFVNDHLCAMLGYTREELIGQSARILYESDEEFERVGRVKYGEIAEQGIGTVETRFRRKDGRVLDILLSSAPLAPGDLSQGVTFTALDITERKQAERAVRQRERQLSAITDNIPGLVSRVDRNLRYLFASQGYKRIFGLSPEDVVGRTMPEILGAEAFKRAEPYVQRALAGEQVTFENPVKMPSGELSFGQTTFIPEIDAEGRVTGFFILGIDITERKKAEEEIRRRNRELIALNRLARRVGASLSVEQTVTAALDEVLAAATPDLVLFFLCQGEELLLQGLAPEDGPYRHPETPVHRLGECLCGLAARTGEPIYVKDIHHDPRCTWEECKRAELCSLAALPIHGGQGVIGVLALASGTERDFEEQASFLETLVGEVAVGLQNALLYEQVQRHAAELEQRVAERTAELEAKNRELETFAYSVSHDLKAPLRGIDGYSRLLLEDYAAQLDEEGRTFLHTIRRATEQMNQLIDDLLTYSRLERRSLTPGRVNPRTLVEALLAERSADIGQRRVSLTVDIPCEFVVADPESLTLALRNLLDNALKFTRDVAQPRIEIGGRQTPDSCIIWVKDNGIGFDMRYHDRIFEIFQQLHRVEDYGGTGVGLAIVRKAAERMRGRVWAESTPGKGATFYLEIPR